MRAIIGLAVTSYLAGTNAQAVQSAPIVNNPPSAQYIAKSPAGGSQDVIAEFAVQGAPNGPGAWFTININTPMPLSGGPFLYHIHDKAVPSDGNCTATGAHLDPYSRGETPPCDPSRPETCQVGDLSGKHGNILELPGFSTEYVDQYISLVPGTPGFIGDRSWVLHYANKTRIACANFMLVDASTAAAGAEPPSGVNVGAGAGVGLTPDGSGSATVGLTVGDGSGSSGIGATVGAGGAGAGVGAGVGLPPGPLSTPTGSAGAVIGLGVGGSNTSVTTSSTAPLVTANAATALNIKGCTLAVLLIALGFAAL